MSSHNGNGHGFLGGLWPSLLAQLKPRRHGDMPYRQLANKLYFTLDGKSSPRSALLVTADDSALDAHGGAALASTMARDLGLSVLLVDGALAAPAASRLFGHESSPGLRDALESSEELLNAVVLPTTQERVFFLPAGSGQSSDAQPKSASNVASVLKAATGRFDFVLVSGGSLLREATAMTLAPLVGSVLLFAVEGETKVDDLAAARETLALCETKNAGVILTTPIQDDPDANEGV